MAWHYLSQEGRKKNGILMHTICLGQNSQIPKTKTTNKWFQRKLPKTKNDTFFFEKGVFWAGWKSGFY